MPFDPLANTPIRSEVIYMTEREWEDLVEWAKEEGVYEEALPKQRPVRTVWQRLLGR
jgi:hypothetical protein